MRPHVPEITVAASTAATATSTRSQGSGPLIESRLTLKLFPRNTVRLTMSARLQLLLRLSLVGLTAAATLHAQDPDTAPATPPKYPLRLHILAIEDTHHTIRMQPNWCGGNAPDIGTGESSPCSSNSSAGLGGGEDDFTGSGRASLVSPPKATLGLNFTYEGCNRIRIAPGFTGLEARWKKPNEKLEVMIPTEAITDGPVRMQRCTLKVVPQDFVYLRMNNGAIIRVTQEAYAKKPALRKYLSGGVRTLERRKHLPKPAASNPS